MSGFVLKYNILLNLDSPREAQAPPTPTPYNMRGPGKLKKTVKGDGWNVFFWKQRDLGLANRYCSNFSLKRKW